MVWRRCHPQGESSTEITHTQPLPKNTLHPQNNTHFDGKASSLFPICEVGQHKKHPGFNPGDNNSPNNFYTYFSSDIINYYHSFNNQWQPGDQKLPNQMLPLPDKTSRTVTPGSSLQQLILQSWEVSSMTKSLCFINKYMLSFFKKKSGMYINSSTYNSNFRKKDILNSSLVTCTGGDRMKEVSQLQMVTWPSDRQCSSLMRLRNDQYRFLCFGSQSWEALIDCSQLTPRKCIPLPPLKNLCTDCLAIVLANHNITTGSKV